VKETFQITDFWPDFSTFPKKMKMKNLILMLAVLLGSVSFSFGQKIYSSDDKYNVDFKVYVTDDKYNCDLIVYKSDDKYNLGNNKGHWYFTDDKYNADKKIYFTDDKYNCDLIIYFTDDKYNTGWKNSSKKHLLY
jgi:hypothetical protein